LTSDCSPIKDFDPLSADQNFGDLLANAVRAKRSAVCVGLDPRLKNLPETLRADVSARNLDQVAQVTLNYCCRVIDAVADFVPVVKPQSAFFELLGPAGMTALFEVIAYARNRGLLVLLDAKRGDIGTTAEGYAEAFLGRSSPWGCDALTVNPYLGDDTLRPFIETANQRAAGIFVLVKTSNPGSGFIQDLQIDGRPIYQRIAWLVEQEAAASAGESGLGSTGAVVGATYPEQLAELRETLRHAWLLIPGFGAQGGTAEDVVHGFRSDGLGAIVNSSRGIIFAYEQPRFQGLDWQEAVARAAVEMSAQLPRA
jgi:orotidine-5'-phosphate decarboxylase